MTHQYPFLHWYQHASSLGALIASMHKRWLALLCCQPSL
ncbi:hypothetical protein GVAMD_0261 [Gardnerella vaginalis AMD]|nr:hypothetical protein GVAMD_0261 [Gardnerella vaginalis AMD]